MIGAAVTLDRLAGRDIAAAEHTGEATVESCVRHGPITHRGFGYWDRCTAAVLWDDAPVTDPDLRDAYGQFGRVTVDAVFSSADIGRTVRVGDLEHYRTARELAYRTGEYLARADVTPRPWLAWIGYGLGVTAVAPGLVAIFLLRGVLRSRRR